MKGVITEIIETPRAFEAEGRGYVLCTEENILMSALPFCFEDGFTATADMIGQEVNFEIADFASEVRACRVRLASLDDNAAGELS